MKRFVLTAKISLSIRYSTCNHLPISASEIIQLFMFFPFSVVVSDAAKGRWYREFFLGAIWKSEGESTLYFQISNDLF